MATEKAIFAGGCFWCTEAIYQRIKGVVEVKSGYASNSESNAPTYTQVSSGGTAFAEAIEVTFDPDTISYKELVYIFLRTHDPTTLNRQGADIGKQYRSEIFVVDDEQKEIAEEEIKTADQEIYDGKIVTKVSSRGKFHEAESYHQDYFNKNSSQPYCQVIINPKLDKFKKEFNKYLKED